MKKILAALTAVIMAASFASCGKKNEGSSSVNKGGNSEAASDSGSEENGSDTSSVSPLANPPVSNANISLDFGSDWVELDSYKKFVKNGEDDKLDYDAYKGKELETTMYLHDGDAGDGTAVVTVTKPNYGENYSKDSVDSYVEAINDLMAQGVDSGEDYKFVSCEAADIGDYRAVYVVQQDNVFGEVVKMDQYQFFDEGDVFTVTFYAPVSRYKELSSEFDSVLNSILVSR